MWDGDACGRSRLASASAAYGPNVTALAGYLSAQHHISVGRVTEILSHLVGVEVSAGWVTAAYRRAEAAVADANTAIRMRSRRPPWRISMSR